MSWIIIKQPHPLDSIWSVAMAAVNDAQDAIDALPSPYTDEEIDALVNSHTAAAQAVIALPARGLVDCIYKMNLTGPMDSGPAAGFDRDAIISEALSLIDAGVSRGNRLLNAVPGLLEGVSL
ncbi:MAG: hypothetical protein CMN63_06950 [Sphingobium sp.]|nr:hypothetical protein [Sphingobium sp.]|tara:strand:- start:2073 stop:2438 length:366 start_codon:yes stop_codon:yes gene_type:complete